MNTIARFALAVTAGATTLAAGCGGSDSPVSQGSANSARDCGSLPSSTEGTDKPVVALLSTLGAGQGMEAVATERSLATVLEGTQRLGARFVLNGVTARPGGPNLVINTNFVGEGPNSLMRDKNLACKTALIKAKTADLAQRARPTSVDTISALLALKDDLKTIPNRQIYVVLSGSVVSKTETGGGTFVDLGKSADLREPARSINRLADAGLNFRCDGWHVTMIGGSHNPDGSAVTATVEAQLRRFWRTYFDHCGGTLEAYSSQIGQFPPPASAIDDADTSQLPITTQRKGRTITATLNGNVLFDSSSAALAPGADGVLRRLAPLLRSSEGVVTIEGHTDSTGPDSVNGPLSKARAVSVADWIVQHADVPRIRVRSKGYGSSRPIENNNAPEGRARNRRVVITMKQDSRARLRRTSD